MELLLKKGMRNWGPSENECLKNQVDAHLPTKGKEKGTLRAIQPKRLLPKGEIVNYHWLSNVLSGSNFR